MTAGNGVVLDANIILRAVLGRRARQLLDRYEPQISFYSPSVCLDEARTNLAAISAKRNLPLDRSLAFLDEVSRMVEFVDETYCSQFRVTALPRIEKRDPDDWPVIATALLLGLPIWTEDYDFFGTGVATWTTDRIEIYLRG